MFNTNFIRKLDVNTLNAIFNVQLEDLIERRHVQDPELFKECFSRATPEDGAVADDIINFSDYAGIAFDEYHRMRAAQNTDAEDDTDDADSKDECEPAMYNVVMVSEGGMIRHFRGGFKSKKDAEKFIDERYGHFIDENGFEWQLEIDDEDTDAE